MSYDAFDNHNYQGLQNPSSNYSNSQNPTSSYLKNKNPLTSPTRVAQANTAASKAKLTTDNDILKELFPNDKALMNNVKVKDYNTAPSKLVRGSDFDAWTNSEKEIFIQSGHKGFIRAYILYHEGLHVLQFKMYGKHPKSYQEMLNYEFEAYGKALKWLDTKDAEGLRKNYGMGVSEFNIFKKLQIKVFAYVKQIVIETKKKYNRIKNKKGANKGNIDIEIFLESMINANMMPNKYVDLKPFYPRYDIKDLYEDTKKLFISKH